MSEAETRTLTDREIALAAPAIRALREAYDLREAINVVALIAKTVVEDDLRRRFYRWATVRRDRT